LKCATFLIYSRLRKLVNC